MNHRRFVCWVFIDALGWELFQRRPLLDRHWHSVAPMQSVLGYSCACDPTLLTGVMPQEHRHFSFFIPAQGQSPFASVSFLKWLPERFENHGRVRSRISRSLARHHGYTGYFQLYHVPSRYLPLFDYSEKRDLYEPGGINGGQPTFFDDCRSREIPFWKADWRLPDAENFEQANRVIDSAQVNFAYLYLAKLDGQLHRDGIHSASVDELIAWYEHQLEQLVALASQRYDDVRFRLISDHGMANVTRTVDLWARLKSSPLKFGTDYLAMLDSTMLRVWTLGNPDKRTETLTRLKQIITDDSDGRWLADDELSDLGCLFEDRLYGEAIYLLHEGNLMVPSFMNRKSVSGMHGYHPSVSTSTALFAASEQLSATPQRLDEVHGQVIRDLDWIEGVTRSHSSRLDEPYREVCAS